MDLFINGLCFQFIINLLSLTVINMYLYHFCFDNLQSFRVVDRDKCLRIIVIILER